MRERVALYDLTSLKRIEVSGPGAPAPRRRLATAKLTRGPGSAAVSH
jgi:glycine cleavage system aminomethyltransferase T